MKPIFIFGCDASSNAFLSALLASHIQCVATPQFSYAYIRTARRGQLELEGAADPGLRSQFGDPLALPQANTTRPEFVERLVAAYASDHARADADVWLEQVDLAQLPLLATTFPDARFLHLVRDGRAVSASDRYAASRISRAWRASVLGGLAAETQLGPERCHRVGYEVLLGDLSAETEVLARFIGLSPGEFRIPASVLNKDYTWHLYGWRAQSSTRAQFETVNGPLLTSLGYGLETVGGNLPVRPDVWAKAGRPRTRQTRSTQPLRPDKPSTRVGQR